MNAAAPIWGGCLQFVAAPIVGGLHREMDLGSAAFKQKIKSIIAQNIVFQSTNNNQGAILR